MKPFLILCLLFVTSFAHGVSFVIPEINTKFSSLDSSISAIEALANGKILMGNGSGASAEVTPSGDVTMTNAGVNAIASDVIINADVKTTAAIAFSKLAALTDAQILVGNGSNVAVDVAVSGDVPMANTGAVTIAAGAVEETMLVVDTADGLHAKRVARATYDFAEHGGAQSAITLGVTLPANALINFAYFYTVTQVVDDGAGTIALHCEDANNLFSAADISGNADAVVVLGVPQNGAGDMVKAIASPCLITITIGGATVSAGKLILFVEYTVVE